MRATCAGCGCDCDDLWLWEHGGRIERLQGACPVGEAWFAQHTAPAAPAARVDGVETEPSHALERAAEILGQARMPLIYGLGQASCEAQRQAVAVAEALGGVVAPADSVIDGSTALAYQARGASTATLGEIRDRAETVVAWRADPATTNPRLLPRLRLDRPGRLPSRALVVVDSRRTATAEQAEVLIELPGELDFDALWALRALLRQVPLAREQASALPWAALERLAARLREADHVAFLYDAGLAGGRHGHAQVLALQALARDLHEQAAKPVHAVTAHLRREANAAGAEAVLAWQTGYPGPVSFARGFPRAGADEFGAAALLAGGEVDAALVVGSDPLEHLPTGAARGLRAIPIVCVDARATRTAEVARVAFTTAAAGLHVPGTAHRLDGVPVTLRAPLPSRRPSQDQLLRELADLLVARAGGAPAPERES